MAVFNGTDANDTLTGSNGDDTLRGFAGSDRILTGDGADLVEAGDGDDEVNGYLSDPAAGVATFWFFAGAKQVLGGRGNDVIFGGSDADRLFGEDGSDRVYGLAGADFLSGGLGADYLEGGEGADSLEGGDDADTLSGDAGDDTLLGGAGNDRLLTGDGIDRVEAGDGDDEVNGYVTDPVTGAYMFWAVSGPKSLWGGEGNDFLLAGPDADSLHGEAGNDSLYGREGDDELLGGPGADHLEGDAGNDLLDGGSGRDDLFGGTGRDTLRGAEDDDVLSGGAESDSLDGGAGADTLFGGDGDDTLAGGPGADILYGGDGNDTYFIDDAGDRLADSGGVDTVRVSVDFFKVPSFIEETVYVDGAQPLPYWIDALLPDEAHGGAFASYLGTGRTMFYAFPQTLPAYDDDIAHGLGYTPFSSRQILRAEQALAYVTTLVDLAFVRRSDPAAPNTLAFANNAQALSAGFAVWPSIDFSGSDVFIDVDSPTTFTMNDGEYQTYTLVHEIGHALGLKHPFDEPASDGDIAAPPYLQGAEDATAWTIMSYNTSAVHYLLQFRPLDLAALHYLYGPSKTARAGDDRHLIDPAGANFIWDGGGHDLVDASSLGTRVTLHLSPGHWGFAGPAKAASITSPGQITVNFGSEIEDLRGTAYGDALFGNHLGNLIEGLAGDDLIEGWGGNDVLDGGGGNDTLLGGDGLDSAMLQATRSATVVLRQVDGTLSLQGPDGRDTLQQVERVIFSDTALAFDVLGIGGSAYRLYQAAYDRAPDAQGLGFWMHYLDRGFDLTEAANNFLKSPEFIAIYGADPTPEQYVYLLYKHVHHREPDAGGLQFWIDAMNNKDGAFGKAWSRGEILLKFSESAENIANLIGVMEDGFAYTPYEPGP